jgi:hypothetical protein
MINVLSILLLVMTNNYIPSLTGHKVPRLAAALDRGMAGLLLLSLVFAPWAFGSTQAWATVVLDITGSLLGALWLLKVLFHSRTDQTGPPTIPGRVTSILLWLTGAVLLYNLVAALNAQAAFISSTFAFRPLPHLTWLPHSYDRHASWMALWQNVALAGTFWAVRSWILDGRLTTPHNADFLCPRALGLVFFIVTNTCLLAIVALFQRLDNTGKLLWLVQPQINQYAYMQFGPFAYRSNGLQYLALVWPLALGLWLVLTYRRREDWVFLWKGRGWMLFCSAILALCPLLWQSRMAALVNLVAIFFVVSVLLASRQNSRHRSVAITVFLLVIGVGMALNWHGLAERFSKSGLQSAERWKLMTTGCKMLRENWLFGTGPGSFPAMYQLYRPDEHSLWQTFLHCDWLQTLVTYGVVGAAPVGAALVVLFIMPWERNKLPAPGQFVILSVTGLITCLLFAVDDFPFQVYSVQQLFLILAAFYSTLSLETS